MPTTAFFSWQSTRPGRNFIDRALQDAIDRISAEIQLEEPERGERIELDRDTRNVAGSPPIFDTILKKIATAAIFVSDLTFVGTSVENDLLPNPNVLIEHGFALRVLGDNRIVAVMNVAYGAPEELPFDLKTKRFPITYNLPDDADDVTRTKVRNKLSKDLEEAIRAVLADPEYLDSLPKPPEPPARFYREPLEGRARFRREGDALGFRADPAFALLGGTQQAVRLTAGPASWLRVAPITPPADKLNVTAIDNRLQGLAILPFYETGPTIHKVRSGDGIGYYRGLDNEPAPSVVFVFRDAEVWTINTVYLSLTQGLIILDEPRFNTTLKQCAEFLNGLGLSGPYRWVAGFGGIGGRMLANSNPTWQKWGPCSDDIIEVEGEFRLGQDPAEVLQKFYREVFEQCGAPRPASPNKV